MEPQLEGCGKRIRPGPRAPSPQLQWSRNLRVAERSRSLRAALAECWLQWSRNLRVAERKVINPPCARPPMLQWSRNLRVAESAKPRGKGAPNRAASMEPQLEGCGKHRLGDAVRRVFAPLQWSRNLRVAESRTGRHTVPAPGTASMEPQLEGCGKTEDSTENEKEDGASMEPQLEGCGKVRVLCLRRPAP